MSIHANLEQMSLAIANSIGVSRESAELQLVQLKVIRSLMFLCHGVPPMGVARQETNGDKCLKKALPRPKDMSMPPLLSAWRSQHYSDQRTDVGLKTLVGVLLLPRGATSGTGC